ncbi:uroporphyrinogen decarboxylase family protein [Bacteroidota bacterium]
MLYSYIAPAAPATRRPGKGNEPDFRPEIGFTPYWYRKNLGIDFGEKWHKDLAYRKKTILKMRHLINRKFPAYSIGYLEDEPDLLTGVFGACTVAGIYGIPIVFSDHNWPTTVHEYLSKEKIKDLKFPDLDENEFFQDLMRQLDWIENSEGRIIGFINWQGMINNAQRLMGNQIFTEMFMQPDLVMHLMDCICTTMIDAAKRVCSRQEDSGVKYDFFTISNCLVNMISPEQYREFILPFDVRIAEAFEMIGIHNCAWNADPYLEEYTKVPVVKYMDMGEDSDLVKAKRLFPDTRRAIMYTPMDFANRNINQIKKDMERIAALYAPCDIVVADLEDVEDEKIHKFLDICDTINQNEVWKANNTINYQ